MARPGPERKGEFCRYAHWSFQSLQSFTSLRSTGAKALTEVAASKTPESPHIL